MTSDSYICSLHVWTEHFFQCRFSTRGKQHIHSRNVLSLMDLMSIIPRITALMKKLTSNSLRSSSHTIDKQLRETLSAPSQKGFVLMGNFTSQTTALVLEKVHEQGIVIVRVPAATTVCLQPLDVSTNKAAKYFLREKFC